MKAGPWRCESCRFRKQKLPFCLVKAALSSANGGPSAQAFSPFYFLDGFTQVGDGIAHYTEQPGRMNCLKLCAFSFYLFTLLPSLFCPFTFSFLPFHLPLFPFSPFYLFILSPFLPRLSI
ncbi:hypothetical protein [Segatella baroniae]|uniref:hypothetical protein n=1 Tax=Segatella baroniae TaxID=305719 RepID=UPI0012DC0B8F|nr:hypothetical protein [Segatella baroniae]